MSAYFESKQRLAIEVLLLFVLPVLLLWGGVVPENLRFFVLALVGVVILLIMRREKWKLRDMGITFKWSWKKDILPYAIFTVIALSALVLYAEAIENTLTPLQGFRAILFLTATFIPVSFLQEFAYRGFLMHVLENVYSDRMTIILYNAGLFTLLHIIFPYPVEMLPLAAVAGLAFASLYSYRRNLILITIVHSILNFVAVASGFFVITS